MMSLKHFRTVASLLTSEKSSVGEYSGRTLYKPKEIVVSVVVSVVAINLSSSRQSTHFDSVSNSAAESSNLRCVDAKVRADEQ
jgi:hypothetical protein